MIDSMIEPQPVEGRGINTISQEGPGLQNKEEPDAGAALPDRDPNFECLEKGRRAGDHASDSDPTHPRSGDSVYAHSIYL
jgi:hypothetical protein